jgi:hypothetical protein
MDSQDSFDHGLYDEAAPADRSQWTNADVLLEDEDGASDVPSTYGRGASSQQPGPAQSQRESDSLSFCPHSEWQEDSIYDDDPPSYIHYSIEWKVTLNNKVVSKDTELEVVLAPDIYWRKLLQPKLEKLLCKKLAKNRLVKSEDTNVVVSVNDRSQRDLTKRFDDTDLDWTVIERQLLKWARLFRAGKKLRLDLSFNYVEVTQPLSVTNRTADKRGSSSVTRQMLTERTDQLDAEEGTTGVQSIWQMVYSLMRCPGAPCHLGPHCWRDPHGKKHYKLKTHHLKSMIRFVEQGNNLQNHGDVPDDIRQQLYAEEQQWLERRQKAPIASQAAFPPINITNVLPAHANQAEYSESDMGTQAVNVRTTASQLKRLGISGLRDVAMKDYSQWQQSNVDSEELKEEFQKACDMALADGLDLELLHADQDSQFFSNKGIKRGIARRFVGDIDRWAKRHKRDVTQESP